MHSMDLRWVQGGGTKAGSLADRDNYPLCDTRWESNCWPLTRACNEDQDCMLLVSKCRHSTGWRSFDACVDNHPLGRGTALEYYSCMVDKCGKVCPHGKILSESKYLSADRKR